MSTRRKEIVETFQSEVSLLTIGGKIIIDLIEDAILDWTWTRIQIKVKLLPLELWKLGENTVNL